MTFADRVLAWYDHYGRQSLPWQVADPYAVWVSEIMLQQTQVATVIPYYKRFMARFPTVESCAHASLEEVLAFWAGLGYYRRAHHLHQAARVWVQHYPKGPHSLAEWMQLPGIGRSTAGAIVSLALGERAPILDANVRRVLWRTHGPLPLAALWELAERLLPTERIGAYNQGLMDIGALCCHVKQPDCAHCPLWEECATRGEALPPRASVNVQEHPMHVHLWWQDHRFYVVKRAADSIWPGLWFLPEAVDCPESGTPFKQRLTHRLLQVVVCTAPVSIPEGGTWISPEELATLACPPLLPRILKKLGVL